MHTTKMGVFSALKEKGEKSEKGGAGASVTK
jgi:hypothetical protein